MLISCDSCKSKYLVNSADLKPDGRTVQCAKCGNQWYQDHIIHENKQINVKETISTSAPSITFSAQNKKNILKQPTPNLPSTYVKEESPKIVNSLLIILIMVSLIIGFWIIKNFQTNSFLLLQFYINEFTFNLKLIFNDIAKIIHHVFN